MQAQNQQHMLRGVSSLIEYPNVLADQYAKVMVLDVFRRPRLILNVSRVIYAHLMLKRLYCHTLLLH